MQQLNDRMICFLCLETADKFSHAHFFLLSETESRKCEGLLGCSIDIIVGEATCIKLMTVFFKFFLSGDNISMA